MDFISYVNSLPNVKIDTIKKIADATRSSLSTVYRWLSGDVTVPPIKRKIISEVLQVPEKILWPDEEEEK